MKALVLFGLTVIFSTLIGCAHSSMRGTVAMKVSDNEAHVCLGDNEVKAGDKVALFRNDCKETGGGGGDGGSGIGICEKVKIGEGKVIRTLNSHYSLIETAPGVKFSEGTVVEKL